MKNKIMFVPSFVFLFCACSVNETYTLRNGTYNVVSNCPDAELQQGTMEVNYRSLFSSRGVEFDDAKKFGLPENLVSNVVDEIKMQDDNRICRAPLFKRNTDHTVFFCFKKNNNVEECKVLIKAI